VHTSPLAECHDYVSRESYAYLNFPTEGATGVDLYFLEAAQVIFIQLLTSNAGGTNADLWASFCTREALASALKGSPCEQYLQNKEWPTIFSTLLNRLRWIGQLPAKAGANSFSFTQFGKQIDTTFKGRNLWLTIPIDHAAPLEKFAATAIALVGNAVLSLPESSLRLLLVTDELGNLPRLGRLEEMVTEGRKPGLSVVSGAQSDAQLRRKYGADGAQILQSCFSTRVMFRAGDAETAESLSRHLGEIEETEVSRSKSKSTRESAGGSHSETEHKRIKRQVPYTEFLNLRDREAYIKMGHYSHAQITIPIVYDSAVNQPFIPRRQGDAPTAAEMHGTQHIAVLAKATSSQTANVVQESPRGSTENSPTNAPPSSPPPGGLDVAALEALAGSATPKGGAQG
jgi:hypothetical protein